MSAGLIFLACSLLLSLLFPPFYYPPKLQILSIHNHNLLFFFVWGNMLRLPAVSLASVALPYFMYVSHK
jgi:hypothetical protein